MAVSDAHVFPGFLTPVLTQLSFQSHRLLFSHASSRGERGKHAGKKVHLNRVSNSQSPGHEPDTLITEPPGQGASNQQLLLFPNFVSSSSIEMGVLEHFFVTKTHESHHQITQIVLNG